MKPGETTKFVRLEPPLRVTLRSPGATTPAELVAKGIHPDALLVDYEGGAGAPPSGAAIELSLDLGGGAGEVHAGATVERGTHPSEGNGAREGSGGPTAVLRFTHLDEDARARLDTFITRNRKSDHIRIVRDEDTSAEGITTGFERFRLPHEALPELDKRKIDLGMRLFGRDLEAPILISCMTGGSELAKTVNRRLAAAAQKLGLALGLGSQRAMLRAPELADTYAVRDLAPDVLLIGNLGAVQLNYGVTAQDCLALVRSVGADALALHLNPLQEAVQPEGDVDFSNLKLKIAALAETAPFPIVLKEVGSGISRDLARWVRGTKIAAVDVAGAGGTNWAKVESYRAEDDMRRRLARSFAGWGIPTADSLAACRVELADRPVFASGGIRDGIEAAKAIALGADLVGLARPFLEAAARSEEAVLETGRLVVEQLRVAMFCCGAGTIAELKRVRIDEAT